MFLHLGADTVVALDDVISINDYRGVRSAANRDFIKRMREAEDVVDISGNTPKSFVVTKSKVYLSAISSLTLRKRSDHLYDHDDSFDGAYLGKTEGIRRNEGGNYGKSR